MKDGFIKVKSVSPDIICGDVENNCDKIIHEIIIADEEKVNVVLFPELSLVGFTCGDLVFSDLILSSAVECLKKICNATKELYPIAIVGVPFVYRSKLYNTAAVIHRGKILGIVPKTNLPNYLGFCEKRYFQSSCDLPENASICIDEENDNIPFSSNIVFTSSILPDFTFGVELCEDLWAPLSPSTKLCLGGAAIMFNCSASPEIIGKASQRKSYIGALSSRFICGYVYSNAGITEDCSSNVYSGHRLIYECGSILSEGAAFDTDSDCIANIDVKKISFLRRLNTSFKINESGMRYVQFDQKSICTSLLQPIYMNPFTKDRAEISPALFNYISQIQINALANRLVQGKFEGLCFNCRGVYSDVHSLFIISKAFEKVGFTKEKSFIYFNNSQMKEILSELCKAFDLCIVYDNNSIPDENVLYLQDDDLNRYATKEMTFIGKHIYSINHSLSESLLIKYSRYIIKNYQKDFSDKLIISNDNDAERDFYEFILYYTVRFGFKPSKIIRLAETAYKDIYSSEELKNMARAFYTEFFSNQSTRNKMPNGVKVGSVSLCSKGDYLIPEFPSVQLYLKDIK